MNKVFVITDTHFEHDTGGFREEGWQTKLIKNWNRMIDDNDLVIHLGDVTFGIERHLKSSLDYLNGNKILVRGNHDKKSNLWYMKNGFQFSCDEFRWNYYGYDILFTHIPSDLTYYQDLNIHGHIHDRAYNRYEYGEGEPWHYLVSLEENGYMPEKLETIVKKWRRKNEQKK